MRGVWALDQEWYQKDTYLVLSEITMEKLTYLYNLLSDFQKQPQPHFIQNFTNNNGKLFFFKD